ncbi:MAG: hypothetical protein D3924_13920 [Candidatus Electrothrix sp. AR4]|nr:hypothetical protein [Candidatus Electrothrix sp. AR4]
MKNNFRNGKAAYLHPDSGGGRLFFLFLSLMVRLVAGQIDGDILQVVYPIRAPRTEMYFGSVLTGISSLYPADKAGICMLGYDAVAVQNQISDYHTGAEAFAQACFWLVWLYLRRR